MSDDSTMDYMRGHMDESADERPTIQSNVRAFHAMIGDIDPAFPFVPTNDIIRLRARLITEEYFETMRSLYRSDVIAESRISRAHELLQDTIADSSPDVDLPELADGLADMAYVIEGTFQAFGIDSAPVHALVHAANMAKRGGPVVDGKQRKPAGWVAPDVAGELERQGSGR